MVSEHLKNSVKNTDLYEYLFHSVKLSKCNTDSFITWWIVINQNSIFLFHYNYYFGAS